MRSGHGKARTDCEAASPTLEDFCEDLPRDSRAITASRTLVFLMTYALLFGTVGFLITLFMYWQGSMLSDGPVESAEGVIVDTPSSSLKVSYEFKADGETYNGTDTLNQAQAKEFEKGTLVSIKYAAGRPGTSCINTPTDIAVRRHRVYLAAGALLAAIAVLLALCCWEHVYTSARCYRALGVIPPIQVARIAHNCVFAAAFETFFMGMGVLAGAQLTTIGAGYVRWHIAIMAGALVTIVLLTKYTPFKKRT